MPAKLKTTLRNMDKKVHYEVNDSLLVSFTNTLKVLIVQKTIKMDF